MNAFALAFFVQLLSLTNASDCSSLKSWNAMFDEFYCCDGINILCGPFGDTVESMLLSNKNLVGPLPFPTINQLGSIKQVQLDQNAFTGKIQELTNSLVWL